MEKAFADIIKKIGEDPTRDGLIDTPTRAAKAFEFLTEGYRRNVKDVVNDALFESDCNEYQISNSIPCANITCFPLSANATLHISRAAKC